jgi:hypothetical protein
MKNDKDLTEYILGMIPKIEDETLSVQKAEAISNAAGKIISMNKLKLEYLVAKKQVTVIEFLDT